MSQAADLLLSLTDSIPEHVHPVVDKDSYFIIDPITRLISNVSSDKASLMQYDHNSERFTFELQRYIDGHDMLLCNRIKVHFNNIESTKLNFHADTCDVNDLRLNPENSETVICSWLISRNATQYAGSLNFLVQYACIEDEEMVYEWHTDIYTDVIIKPGMDNSDAAIIPYSDILEQWRERLFSAEDSVTAAIEEFSTNQQAEIEAKGN